jgi:hypothetical protein
MGSVPKERKMRTARGAYMQGEGGVAIFAAEVEPFFLVGPPAGQLVPERKPTCSGVRFTVATGAA